MPSFRLLAGMHEGRDYTQPPVKRRDLVTGEIVEEYPRRRYTIGEAVESDKDLVAMFGTEHFQALDSRPAPAHPGLESMPQTQYAFPHGQVLQGHQVTGNLPDGRPVSGPMQPVAEGEEPATAPAGLEQSSRP
jgi:hypothetical protein